MPPLGRVDSQQHVRNACDVEAGSSLYASLALCPHRLSKPITVLCHIGFLEEAGTMAPPSIKAWNILW